MLDQLAGHDRVEAAVQLKVLCIRAVNAAESELSHLVDSLQTEVDSDDRGEVNSQTPMEPRRRLRGHRPPSTANIENVWPLNPVKHDSSSFHHSACKGQAVFAYSVLPRMVSL